MKKSEYHHPVKYLNKQLLLTENEEEYVFLESLIPRVQKLESVLADSIFERQILNGKFRIIGADAEQKRVLIAKVEELSREIKSVEDNIKQILNEVPESICAKDSKASEAPVSYPCYFDKYFVESGHDSVVVQLEDNSNEYQQYVDSHAASTSYHDWKISEIVENVLGQKCLFFSARDNNGTIKGVFPVAHLRTLLFGNYMVSMPWFNYGGPLADNEYVYEELIIAGKQYLKSMSGSYLLIRDTINTDEKNTALTKVSMYKVLPSTKEELIKGFGASVRSQYGKAERLGFQVKIGDTDLVKDFYTVFSRNMRDLGTPVLSVQFFEKMLSTFSNAAFIAVIYEKDKPIASGFLLEHGATLEIPWASSIREYNSTGANMLLYKEVLVFAVESGYSHFDFGRSSKGGSTWRFKKQWGSAEHQLYWRCVADGDHPVQTHTPENNKYNIAIRLWKKLPIVVANKIGPILIRGIA